MLWIINTKSQHKHDNLSCVICYGKKCRSTDFLSTSVLSVSLSVALFIIVLCDTLTLLLVVMCVFFNVAHFSCCVMMLLLSVSVRLYVWSHLFSIMRNLNKHLSESCICRSCRMSSLIKCFPMSSDKPLQFSSWMKTTGDVSHYWILTLKSITSCAVHRCYPDLCVSSVSARCSYLHTRDQGRAGGQGGCGQLR